MAYNDDLDLIQGHGYIDGSLNSTKMSNCTVFGCYRVFVSSNSERGYRFDSHSCTLSKFLMVITAETPSSCDIIKIPLDDFLFPWLTIVPVSMVHATEKILIMHAHAHR